jgi:hypothetical protein
MGLDNKRVVEEASAMESSLDDQSVLVTESDIER